MEKREIVKVILKLCTEIGCGTIVANAVTAYLPYQVKLPVRVCCWLATVAITGAVSSKAGDWIDEQVDNVFEVIGMIDNALEQAEINTTTIVF